MSSNLADITSQALALPEPDRFALARKLWESLHPPAETAETILSEAQRRDREMDQEIVQGLSHEEVMRAARKTIE